MSKDDKKRGRTAGTAARRTRRNSSMPTQQATRAAERGHRVAQARKRAGLSQEALAEQVGVGRQTIARVELGTQRPGVEIALAIAAAVGESVEALFGDGDR
jgi:putative transcriptional regulator